MFNNLNQLFIHFVMDEEMTLADLNIRIARQNAIVAGLIAGSVRPSRGLQGAEGAAE
ncbi:MAG: hypothetical protein R3D61_05455 [Defluviimonas denitrificans]